MRKYKKGEAVFRQGELGFGMYIIVKGSINIAVEDTSGSDDEYNIDEVNEIIPTQLVPGNFFGKLFLIEEDGRRSATARASDESVLVGFLKPDLFEILERIPTAGVKITLRLCQVIGQRLKETNESLSQHQEQLRQFRAEK